MPAPSARQRSAAAFGGLTMQTGAGLDAIGAAQRSSLRRHAQAARLAFDNFGGFTGSTAIVASWASRWARSRAVLACLARADASTERMAEPFPSRATSGCNWRSARSCAIREFCMGRPFSWRPDAKRPRVLFRSRAVGRDFAPTHHSVRFASTSVVDLASLMRAVRRLPRAAGETQATIVRLSADILPLLRSVTSS